LSPQRAVTQYKLDIWQEERGFTYGSIFDILQTHDDYIWLGTLKGLVRFDGIRFKVFNRDNTDQLKDNTILVLREDREGTLWIGTSTGGLSCLKNGTFTTYTLKQCPALKNISTIFVGRDGTLWIGSLTSGLTRLKNGKFTNYTTGNGLPSNKVRAFLEDEAGRLWIATSAGLTIRDPFGKFSDYLGKNGRFDKYIISMCKRKNGEIWIGCSNGLYCLKDNGFTHYGKSEGLPNLKIKCLYEDKDENLWAGTDGGGLVRIKNGIVETLFTQDGLACDLVYSICEDREGSLWFATLTGGLHRLRDTFITTYTTKEGLVNDKTTCISEDRDGSIWVGTAGQGVNRLKDGKVTLRLTTRQGLLSNVVNSIIGDRAGDVWIGTYKGLNRFNHRGLKSFTTGDGLSHSTIFYLLEDKEGVIWIDTRNIINRFSNGKFSVFAVEEVISQEAITCIYEDRGGNVWFGAYNSGLYRFQDGVFSTFTTQNGLVNNNVECIYQDREGILYIGTRGGLSCLVNMKFSNYTIQNGLMDNDIRCILQDELGNLWLASRVGISCISKKEFSGFSPGKKVQIHPVTYDVSDGMKKAWCGSGIKAHDGRLWFTTSKGVVMIDPANIKKNRLTPPVVIEEMIVDGEMVNTNQGNEPVILPPGKKRLEFHYTALSFIKPRKMKFKLKLEGYDNDWIDAGNNRTTTYTELSPGNYTFHVTACNSDGVWNEKGASLLIYLQPHFYQTTWFYLFVIIFVFLAAFSFYRFRVRQLKVREKELSTQVDQRTRDLKERNIQLEKAHQKIRHSKELIEAKNQQLEEQSEKLKEMDQIKSRFFANISHEFRTPLTLIMGPIEQRLSLCRDKQQERELQMMLRNSQRLLSLINQLLDLSKLDSGKMKLQAVRQNIIPFLKGLVGSFESLVIQKPLDLTFQTEEENILLYYDPEKLEKVICNLVSNAVKFTPPKGKITVSAKKYNAVEKNYPGGYLEISFRDTGIGIPENQLIHIFDRFYQADGSLAHEHHQKGSGIGLALVKELVTLHHGDISVHSSEGKGTEFIIRLPLGKTHLKPDEIFEKVESVKDVEAEALVYQSEQKKPFEVPTDDMIEKEENRPEQPGADEPGEEEKNVILVVDDSADVRIFIKSSLEPLYTIVEAADGREGIDKARAIIPDLIVSDVMMPNVDGYELCQELKTDIKTSHIPVVLLTAKASEENIIEGLETGADDYITKPFNTKILLTRIKNLIDLRCQLQEKIQREMTLQPTEIAVSSMDQEFMRELKKTLEKNMADEEFGVDELAKGLYMSRATLNRKLRALTGESTNQFIQSYRLKRAAQLLKTNFGNVTEVAFEVGFSNSAYFTKCFKDKFHRLPHTFQASESEN
jgi:signal transduction histidine kinase/ligand-binding sensor domain-containing protein/DNA-binding response OmpR family regulator